MAAQPRLEIQYCGQCRCFFALSAKGLLMTFERELGGVALVSGTGGIFEVRLDGETIWSRRAQAGFPELASLRRLVRDRVAPERELGHSEGRS